MTGSVQNSSRVDANWRRFVPTLLFAAAIGLCACDQLSTPISPTPNAASIAPVTPLPPAPSPTYTVAGRITDASEFGGGGGLNAGRVTVLNGERAGTSALITTGGAYTLRDLPGGTITISASSAGYRTIEQTRLVERDETVNFALPRTALSPQPSLAGTWAGVVKTTAGVSPAEFTFVQTGASISGTWRAPYIRWSGTVRGTVDGERSVTGQIAVDNGCSANSDISWGLLEYDERRLYLATRLFGSCSPGNDYAFEITRQCRLVNDASVECS